jgi:hypothetical protein
MAIRFSPIGKSVSRLIALPLARGVYVSFMSFSPQSTLSDAEKLDVLRQLDQFRKWHSLDDKRFCLACGKIINGKQIQITSGTRGNGRLRLSCPTERCNSIPMDWVLPTDELVALAATTTSDDYNTASSEVADRGEEQGGLASRLRKFALNLKLAF